MPSPAVKEAQSLRNLGFYPQAEDKFREAIAAEVEDGVLLRIEFASMLMEQGIVKGCREELLKIREQGMEMSPLGEMLLCCVNAYSAMTYSESLSIARVLYNSHLKDRRPEEYDKTHVRSLLHPRRPVVVFGTLDSFYVKGSHVDQLPRPAPQRGPLRSRHHA